MKQGSVTVCPGFASTVAFGHCSWNSAEETHKIYFYPVEPLCHYNICCELLLNAVLKCTWLDCNFLKTCFCILNNELKLFRFSFRFFACRLVCHKLIWAQDVGRLLAETEQEGLRQHRRRMEITSLCLTLCKKCYFFNTYTLVWFVIVCFVVS